MISVIGRTLPTIPTMLPTNASRPDESISIHDGAVPLGVVMVTSQRPISLTSRAVDRAGGAFGDVAAPDVSEARTKARKRVIDCSPNQAWPAQAGLPSYGMHGS